MHELVQSILLLGHLIEYDTMSLADFHISLLNQASKFSVFTVLFVFLCLFNFALPHSLPLATVHIYSAHLQLWILLPFKLNSLQVSALHGSLTPNKIITDLLFDFNTLNIALAVKPERLQWQVKCLCTQTFRIRMRVAVHVNATLNDSKACFCNITVNQLIGQLKSYVGTEALIYKLWI